MTELDRTMPDRRDVLQAAAGAMLTSAWPLARAAES
jgi:hypothetical protein